MHGLWDVFRPEGCHDMGIQTLGATTPDGHRTYIQYVAGCFVVLHFTFDFAIQMVVGMLKTER